MKNKWITFGIVASMLMSFLNMPPSVSASTTPEDIVLVSEDFSDTTKYAVGTAYTGDQMATKNDNLVYYYDGFSKNTAASFTVKQIDENDASKGKYLEFGHGTVNKHSVIGGNFDTVTKGTLVTEMKLRIPDLSSSPARNKVFICGFRGTETANTLRYEASATANPTFSRIRGETDNCIFDTTNVTDKLAKDENGFYSMRFVWNRETTSDNWDVKLYDAYTGKVVLSNNSVSMTDITNIRFAQEYAVNTDSNAPIDLADIKVYIPAAPTFTENVPYNSETKTISFTVSEDLKEDTVKSENVKVTGPSGENVEVSPSWDADEDVLTLSFPYGLPANGDYTVAFPGVLTHRCVNMNTTVTFTGEKTVIPVTVTEVSPEEGVISNRIGSINLKFSHELDTDTISAVTFKKSNGDEIIGGYNVSADGNKITITFGELQSGDYVLKVGTGLMASNGDVLTEEVSYNYTAQEMPDVYEDYSDYELGEYTVDQLQDANSALTYKTAGRYDVVEENDDRFVKMTATAKGNAPGISVYPREDMDSGTIEIDVAMRRTDGPCFTNLFGVIASDANSVMTLVTEEGGNTLKKSGDSKAVGGTLNGQPTSDANGFMKLRFSVGRSSPSDNWDCYLYDMLPSSPVKIYTATIAADKLKDITRISVISIYTTADEQIGEGLDLSDISVKVYSLPKVVSADCTDASPAADRFTLKIDSDIDASEFGAEIVKKDDESVVIKTECTYDAQNREVELNLKSFLDYGTEYIIRFANDSIPPYSFTTQAASLKVVDSVFQYKNAGGEVIDSIPAEGTCNAVYNIQLNNPEQESREIVLILISYDANGMITDIEPKTITSSLLTISDTIMLEGITQASANKLRCFIWEKTQTGYESIK